MKAITKPNSQVQASVNGAESVQYTLRITERTAFITVPLPGEIRPVEFRIGSETFYAEQTKNLFNRNGRINLAPREYILARYPAGDYKCLVTDAGDRLIFSVC